MPAVRATLIVRAVSTRLFTELLMTILLFFQRTLKNLTAPESVLVMQRFFGVAHERFFRLNLVRDLGPRAALILFLAGLALAYLEDAQQ